MCCFEDYFSFAEIFSYAVLKIISVLLRYFHVQNSTVSLIGTAEIKKKVKFKYSTCFFHDSNSFDPMI